MDPHREVAKVIGYGLVAAFAVGALVGHTVDLVIHRHRQ